ncbi:MULTISPECIES: carbohydrate ABC transporter permease [Paenibacillus]|uniref:Multiple sugar transport system permease protein n=1 Tax=Paenibacillus aceris TaxID=869555 RepID=A0ABS4I2Y0_9BACL|nr:MULTISPECIES: sugar ABC transporter permease [Paenibacillus]MBP1965269.1 multiple sugar transport system permease protein [Paenibacillus aceris]MEC0270580.1 sugar ABC transporter permease [Paenibacillus anseongense]NHW35952.1 sugar ABC transporter permease [Paenibacillus aceris]
MTTRVAKASRSIRGEFWGLFFIAPFAILFLIFEIYPIVNAFYLSFFDYGLGKKEWIGLGNYAELMSDRVFLRSIANTFGFVFGTVPLTFIFAIFAAVLIYGKHKHIASFFRGAFYLPIITSQVILSLIWAWIYSPVNGIANYALSLFGAKPVMWLSDERVALLALILVVVTFNVGQPIILLLAALGNISPEYYEAADIDGASAPRKFWHITLPLLKPTSLYILVMSTIWAFQTFVVVQMLTGGGPNYATSTIMFLLYETAFVYGKLGAASAMGIIITVLISIVAVVQFKLMKSDIQY